MKLLTHKAALFSGAGSISSLEQGCLLGSQELLQLLHEVIDNDWWLENASKAAEKTYGFENLVGVIFPR